MERAAEVFARLVQPEAPPVDLKALHAKIGELPLENGIFRSALTRAGLLAQSDD